MFTYACEHEEIENNNIAHTHRHALEKPCISGVMDSNGPAKESNTGHLRGSPAW